MLTQVDYEGPEIDMRRKAADDPQDRISAPIDHGAWRCRSAAGAVRGAHALLR
jgi:hypothetical protein